MWNTLCILGRGIYYVMVACALPFAMLFIVPIIAVRMMMGVGGLANNIMNGR